MLANDMRRLAEEISNAYEERVGRIAEIKQETEEELARFRADLDAAEAERKSTTQADLKEMADQLRSHLDRFKADLDAVEAERKSTTQADLKEMADQLRSHLDRFKADLDAAEAERKSTTQAELNEKAEELRGSLTSFRADLSATVAGMMGELKMDRSEAVKAWSEILSTMRFAGGEVEAKVQVKTASEAIEEEEAELEKKEGITKDAAKREELMSEIVGLLKDNPDGLRMVKVADLLGIESWRSLIPVMRELLDNGEITKEDSIYYGV